MSVQPLEEKRSQLGDQVLPAGSAPPVGGNVGGYPPPQAQSTGYYMPTQAAGQPLQYVPNYNAIQPAPMVVVNQPTPAYAMVMPQSLPDHLRPHNFLIISIIVTAICGLVNILTLSCTVPAILLAFLSYAASDRGDYNQAKLYSNFAFGLIVGAVLFGFLCIAVGLICFAVYWPLFFYYD